MRIQPDQAGARVAAKLARPPSDALEARVVLEAWGGVRPDAARAVAPAAVDAWSGTDGTVVTSRRRAEEASPETAADALMLAAAVLATAVWATLLATAARPGAATEGWRVALPLSIAIQWVLARRHLVPAGLGGLRADGVWMWGLGTVAGVVVATVLVESQVALVVSLTVPWLVVPLIVRRGWWLPAAAVLGASGALIPLVPVVPLAAATALVLLATLLAAITTAPPARSELPPWRCVALAAPAGAMAGLLLAFAIGGSWDAGVAIVIASMLPSLAAGILSARQLARLWVAVPEALASVNILETTGVATARRNARAAVVAVVAASVTILVTVLAVVSVAVVAFAPARMQPTLRHLLWGLALFALVMLIVCVVEALAGLARASIVVAAAMTAWLLSSAAEFSPMGGATAGAAATALVFLVGPVSAPDRWFSRLL